MHYATSFKNRINKPKLTLKEKKRKPKREKKSINPKGKERRKNKRKRIDFYSIFEKEKKRKG